MVPAFDASRRLSDVHGPRGPIALVPSLEQVGRSQMVAIKAREEQRMEVFWSREDAVRWLNGISAAD